MKTPPDFRLVAYGVIGAGCALAFMTAVVPHYDAGHRLAVGALVAGLAPYIVYGALSAILRGWSLLLPGLVALGMHAGLVAAERLLWYDGYQGSAVYYGPALSMVIALPLGAAVGRRLNRKR